MRATMLMCYPCHQSQCTDPAGYACWLKEIINSGQIYFLFGEKNNLEYTDR